MVAHLVAERPRAARLATVHVSQVTSHEKADGNWEPQKAEQVSLYYDERNNCMSQALHQ